MDYEKWHAAFTLLHTSFVLARMQSSHFRSQRNASCLNVAISIKCKAKLEKKKKKLPEENSYLGHFSAAPNKDVFQETGRLHIRKQTATYEKSMVCLSLSQAFHFAQPLKLQHFMLLPGKNQSCFFHIFMQTKWQIHILLYILSGVNASCACLLHYDSSSGTLPNSHFPL